MHTHYHRANMKPEIIAAVGFLSKFLRTKGMMNDRELQTFNLSLQELLAGKSPVGIVSTGIYRAIVCPALLCSCCLYTLGATFVLL